MTFPPKPPRKRTKPYPPGTLVTGSTQTGIFGFPGHKEHGGLFMLEDTATTAEENTSNSGFHQAARCLLCGDEWSAIDCEFLMVKVTRAQMLATLKLINKARSHLLQARKEIRELLAP
jgi:hypothetical protein